MRVDPIPIHPYAAAQPDAPPTAHPPTIGRCWTPSPPSTTRTTHRRCSGRFWTRCWPFRGQLQRRRRRDEKRWLVTKIWSVKGRLDAVIRYAGNEEKTRLPDLTGLSAGKDDLSDVLQYAANDAKTTRKSQLFVSGVNCVPEIARQQMELTKQQFGKTGGTVAFHAYQSFRPGEVTPEQCHAIGVELAKRVWGDRFQVLVTTHLNTDCCHNHFVINSVSFVDGKRYNDCKKDLSGSAKCFRCTMPGAGAFGGGAEGTPTGCPATCIWPRKPENPPGIMSCARTLILPFCAARRPEICPASFARWAMRWTSIPTTNTRPSSCLMTAVPCASRRWERNTPRRQWPSVSSRIMRWGFSNAWRSTTSVTPPVHSPLSEAASGLPQGHHGSVRHLPYLPVLLLSAGQAAHRNTQLPPTSSGHAGGLPPLGGN